MRIIIFFAPLFFTAFGNYSAALAGDLFCKITDTDTDADMDSAGPNARCGKGEKGPWACYCDLTEECRDKDSGQTQIYHRSQFLGCGSLRDCKDSSSYGRQCQAMED
jgi:hypothetical protein